MADVTYGACCVDDYSARALGCDLMVHYGHSCLIPVDRTSGIKMLYVFVDIKLDSLHFIETLKANLDRDLKLSLVSTIQFVATLQAAASDLREAGFNVEIPQVRLFHRIVRNFKQCCSGEAAESRRDPGLHLAPHEGQSQPGLPRGREIPPGERHDRQPPP